MATINPYLNFNGNTEEAFKFYKSVFGGEFKAFQRFKDTPGCEGIPATDGNKIMHVALPIGKGNILMATDTLESMGHAVSSGTNVSICINTDSEEQTRDLFNKLAEGGKIGMPLDKMFWGDYFGMVTDKFGIQWMVDYDYSQEKSASKKTASPVEN